jgi:anti-anti-sigma factor
VDLQLSERIHDRHVVVALRGELDVSTAPELRERLSAILARDPASLILDLSGLEFMDSTGISVLVAAEQRADPRGWTFSLAGPQKLVGRVLSITSLDRYFRIFPTVEDALRAGRETGPAGRETSPADAGESGGIAKPDGPVPTA